jgi:hypothetical protein
LGELVAKMIERKDQENRARLAELVESPVRRSFPEIASDAPRIGARLFNSVWRPLFCDRLDRRVRKLRT